MKMTEDDKLLFIIGIAAFAIGLGFVAIVF